MSVAASGAGAGTAGNITLPPAGSVVLPAHATQAQIDQYIQANFGYMAWALAVPELRTILEKSVGPNGLTVDQNTFDGLVRNTNWYKNNTQAMRSWVQMLGEDPQTAKAQLDKQQATISTEARLMGLNLNSSDLSAIAEQSIAYQWDKGMMDQALYAEATRQYLYQGRAQVGNLTGSGMDSLIGTGAKRAITDDPFGGGTLSESYAKVMQMASDYLVTVSPTTAAQWAIGMSTGQMDPTAVQGNVITLAKGKFPSLAKEIESGLTPKQVMDPITQDVAKTLEISPDQVDYTKPQWSQILQYRDPTSGQVRTMTDAEATNWARTQNQPGIPNWKNTANAASSAADTVRTLGTLMGAEKF